MTGWSSWRRASRAALSWPHRALKSRGAVNQVGERIPLVVVNREVPWLSGLLIDTPSGLAQALDYLVSLGHLRIAYVRGPATSWTDEARYRALRTAAQQHSVELVPVGAFRPTLSAGAAAADAVALTGVTAAIFFNDTLAIGALGRFQAARHTRA